MLVSYVPKREKNVTLVSNMHFENKINKKTGNKYKPKIIFYNSTKHGIDIVDEMKGTYSVARKNAR